MLSDSYLYSTLVELLACALLAGISSAQPPPPPSPGVWFEDLVDAEPLAVPTREDLARYLSELVLDTEAGKATMPKSLVDDHQPRMLFLSLGDGTTEARVLRAEGHGIAAPIADLRERLQELGKSGFEARGVRIDLVTEVRPAAAYPDRASDLPRSLYGLAFERDLGLAFLADEVVAHTLITSEQHLRLQNIKKQPRASAVRPQLDRLYHLATSGEGQRSDGIPLFRFTTAAFFSDGGQTAPLFRGHRWFDHLDPEQLLAHAELGGGYLTRSVGPTGRFTYAYLPKTNRVKASYNALRHCGTIYSMLELYEVTGDGALLQAAERAISFLEKQLMGRCTVGDTETACVVEGGEVKLGGNALAIVALAKFVEVTGNTRHSRLIDELGQWILLTQAESGELTVHKQTHPEGEVSSFVSGYYPGEALLALVRRPEPDPTWLDAAERGARWLIEVRDKNLPLARLNHDHWLLYALRDLHRRRPDPLYLQHAGRITEAILSRQRQQSPRFPDWLGSYYDPPRSTPTATRSEGLGAAYEMFRDAGKPEQAAKLKAALELGARFQLQTQLLPETVLYLRDPARALGGFRRSLTDYEVRIDYVQHNLSALLLLRRILLQESAPRENPSRAWRALPTNPSHPRIRGKIDPWADLEPRGQAAPPAGTLPRPELLPRLWRSGRPKGPCHIRPGQSPGTPVGNRIWVTSRFSPVLCVLAEMSDQAATEATPDANQHSALRASAAATSRFEPLDSLDITRGKS